MLTIEHQILLQNAAAKKDPQLLDAVIMQIKADSPSNFFWGDDDPNLKKRVFFHMPWSAKWSGTAIVTEKAIGTKYK